MNVDRETIQNRSTDAVFERGENYRDEGRIQRLDRFGDPVLATDPSPAEFDTYAGVLEARASTEPPINNEQFWRALDDLEE